MTLSRTNMYLYFAWLVYSQKALVWFCLFVGFFCLFIWIVHDSSSNNNNSQFLHPKQEQEQEEAATTDHST